LTDQVIFDRGYRKYEGPRLGPSVARVAVYKDGIRRVLGLGRKARRKVFPWSLIAVALIAAAIVVGTHWVIGNIEESFREGVPTYGGLFDFYSGISLLFIAFSGPLLLIPDRTEGVLSVYFSRPLTVDGYLGAKAASFATVVGAIYLVPQIVLHLGLGLIADEGFLPYMGAHLDILWKVPVITLGFVALHGAVIFVLSAWINRTGIAAASFLGILIAGGAIAGQVSQASFAGSRWVALLALDHHPRIIRDELLGDTVEYPAEAAGFGMGTSIAVIAILVAISIFVVRRRYRSLA
jgi:ABC-2 type transport system permease protein